MDSIATIGLQSSLKAIIDNNNAIGEYLPSHWVKFTFKAGYNQAMSNVVGHVETDGMRDVSTEDYFNLTMYDLRMKVYVNKRLRILNRVLASGIYTKKYLYQSGVIIKIK